MQELIQNLAFGTIPRNMWIVFENDLVDCCKPGDDVTICGVVMRRWKPVKVDVSVQLFTLPFQMFTNSRENYLIRSTKIRHRRDLKFETPGKCWSNRNMKSWKDWNGRRWFKLGCGFRRMSTHVVIISKKTWMTVCINAICTRL